MTLGAPTSDHAILTPSEAVREFGAEIRTGLSATPKRLPTRYLYDPLGSQLFEAICRLPWYRITTAELQLLERQAGAIVEALGPDGALIELGCGSGEKLAILLRAAARAGVDANVHLVDISEAALDLSVRTVAAWTRGTLTTHQATYEEGLRQVARAREPKERNLALFLGSNIGNFYLSQAESLLAQIQDQLDPGDLLLLGGDLVKPEPDLQAAYDDPLGVTAAFNRNILVRLNREMGGEFDIDQFGHRAVWNPESSRVELYLVSRSRQRVRVAALDLRVDFEPGETIWTESSQKFTPESLAALGARAGFRRRQQWVESDAGFALTLFEVPAAPVA